MSDPIRPAGNRAWFTPRTVVAIVSVIVLIGVGVILVRNWTPISNAASAGYVAARDGVDLVAARDQQKRRADDLDKKLAAASGTVGDLRKELSDIKPKLEKAEKDVVAAQKQATDLTAKLDDLEKKQIAVVPSAPAATQPLATPVPLPPAAADDRRKAIAAGPPTPNSPTAKQFRAKDGTMHNIVEGISLE